ncbi:MAG: hypothetical protein R6U36_11370 [Candidatus Fermentibacteraceae bacterium]
MDIVSLMESFRESYGGRLVGGRSPEDGQEDIPKTVMGSLQGPPTWMGEIQGRTASIEVVDGDMVSVSVVCRAEGFLSLKPRRLGGIMGLYARIFRGARFPEDPEFDRSFTIGTNDREMMSRALGDVALRERLSNLDGIYHVELSSGTLQILRTSERIRFTGMSALWTTAETALMLAERIWRTAE